MRRPRDAPFACVARLAGIAALSLVPCALGAADLVEPPIACDGREAPGPVWAGDWSSTYESSRRRALAASDGETDSAFRRRMIDVLRAMLRRYEPAPAERAAAYRELAASYAALDMPYGRDLYLRRLVEELPGHPSWRHAALRRLLEPELDGGVDGERIAYAAPRALEELERGDIEPRHELVLLARRRWAEWLAARGRFFEALRVLDALGATDDPGARAAAARQRIRVFLGTGRPDLARRALEAARSASLPGSTLDDLTERIEEAAADAQGGAEDIVPGGAAKLLRAFRHALDAGDLAAQRRLRAEAAGSAALVPATDDGSRPDHLLELYVTEDRVVAVCAARPEAGAPVPSPWTDDPDHVRVDVWDRASGRHRGTMETPVSPKDVQCRLHGGQLVIAGSGTVCGVPVETLRGHQGRREREVAHRIEGRGVVDGAAGEGYGPLLGEATTPEGARGRIAHDGERLLVFVSVPGRRSGRRTGSGRDAGGRVLEIGLHVERRHHRLLVGTAPEGRTTVERLAGDAEVAGGVEAVFRRDPQAGRIGIEVALPLEAAGLEPGEHCGLGLAVLNDVEPARWLPRRDAILGGTPGTTELRLPALAIVELLAEPR